MANGFQIPQPKAALRQAALFPAQVFPAQLGRPLSNVLNSMTDVLPDIALPSNLSSPVLPNLAIPANVLPPSPKMFAMKAETVLPAGAPRISTLLPDINVPTSSSPGFSVTSAGGGGRSITKTTQSDNSGRSSGGVKSGGYRSI